MTGENLGNVTKGLKYTVLRVIFTVIIVTQLCNARSYKNNECHDFSVMEIGYSDTVSQF